ncbi:hypothetical protein BLNAU_1899 [Blattamonas nauphoetae]|uniref:UBA domain-containing protein n=1 Tax=Blattamonas nauphoetae TaxID=2049346 RepID=A0ABQ9YI89_9EUKA|nr:hypothetical protein BLNAU_1899 [Blattamonas nauphoetae]
MVSSSKHHVRSLLTLLTPNQPQHATMILSAIQCVSRWIDPVAKVKHFWNGWLSRFFNTVNPSNMPFTHEYVSLHDHLVEVMCNIINSFEECEPDPEIYKPTVKKRELKKFRLSFLTLSKDYLVHLSRNVFTNRPHNAYTISSLLSRVMRFDLNTPTAEAFYRNLKQEMNSSALASSSPPFILTTELVCHLSDSETIDVVDRIVTLLDSNSSLDDYTILQICKFISFLGPRSLQLVFRNTGRTKEQYFHAFESFISLHIEPFYQAPINSLLSSRPDDHEPTFDEWDDIDLETVSIVMQIKTQNQLSIISKLKESDNLILKFIIDSLQQARHCTTRLTRTQLERLIAPSIDCLHAFFHQPSSLGIDYQTKTKLFRGIFSVYDQPVVTRAISKTGIFFRIVNGLTNSSEVEESIMTLLILIKDERRGNVNHKTERMLRRGGSPMIGEEGLDDAMESVTFMKTNIHISNFIKNQTHCILQCFGANLPNLNSDDARDRHYLHRRRLAITRKAERTTILRNCPATLYVTIVLVAIYLLDLYGALRVIITTPPQPINQFYYQDIVRVLCGFFSIGLLSGVERRLGTSKFLLLIILAISANFIPMPSQRAWFIPGFKDGNFIFLYTSLATLDLYFRLPVAKRRVPLNWYIRLLLYIVLLLPNFVPFQRKFSYLLRILISFAVSCIFIPFLILRINIPSRLRHIFEKMYGVFDYSARTIKKSFGDIPPAEELVGSPEEILTPFVEGTHQPAPTQPSITPHQPIPTAQPPPQPRTQPQQQNPPQIPNWGQMIENLEEITQLPRERCETVLRNSHGNFDLALDTLLSTNN